MSTAVNTNRLGIICMLVAMFCISLNDMLVKSLSGDYPLHQLMFTRSSIGVLLSIVILQFEGGFARLRTAVPWWHVLRTLCVVFANLSFYAAIVTIPLATATAIYFVAPLLVTLLSIPVLGEKVGPRRMGAICMGFVGVLVMQWPQLSGAEHSLGWIAILPVMAAMGYATASVLTRKLGAGMPASALSIYMQSGFMVVSLLFYAVAGDGKFLQADSNDSIRFLMRPWVWPAPADLVPMLGLGLIATVVGYTISQAYRLAVAAVVAPFEYVLLLYAMFWGWFIFSEWPAPTVFAGAAIIISAGIYIVWRERQVKG